MMTTDLDRARAREIVAPYILNCMCRTAQAAGLDPWSHAGHSSADDGAHVALEMLPGIVAALSVAREDGARAMLEALDRIEAALASASEERYQLLNEWRSDAEKWKVEGDMYGWNFHQGMAGGANWTDILYRRIGREIEAIRKRTLPGEPRATGGTA